MMKKFKETWGRLLHFSVDINFLFETSFHIFIPVGEPLSKPQSDLTQAPRSPQAAVLPAPHRAHLQAHDRGGGGDEAVPPSPGVP